MRSRAHRIYESPAGKFFLAVEKDEVVEYISSDVLGAFTVKTFCAFAVFATLEEAQEQLAFLSRRKCRRIWKQLTPAIFSDSKLAAAWLES
jgi:hypothetical protein